MKNLLYKCFFAAKRRALKSEGFTLIELLIVIAVGGILATVAVLILNPGEIMKETRDSKRLEDLNHINIAVLEAKSLSPNINLGIASSVYISVPDSSATCVNLGLPSLSTGWSYRCSPSADFRKTDGAGWIPVNFSSVEGGSVFASIPIDPINATSSGQYYTYTPANGFHQLSGLFESLKYGEKSFKDGGIDPAQYEIGDNLALAPFSHGLKGYWKFAETGTSANDSTGFNNGIMYSSGTPTDLHTITGCKVSSCINVDDDIGSQRVEIPAASFAIAAGDFSLCAWFKGNDTSGWLVSYNEVNANGEYGLHISSSRFAGRARYSGSNNDTLSNTAVANNVWHFGCSVVDALTMKIYLNGQLENSRNLAGVKASTTANFLYIGDHNQSPGGSGYDGLIDEVFIFTRVLSPSQIKAIYDATK